jgi:hypothetical protein
MRGGIAWIGHRTEGRSCSRSGLRTGIGCFVLTISMIACLGGSASAAAPCVGASGSPTSQGGLLPLPATVTTIASEPCPSFSGQRVEFDVTVANVAGGPAIIGIPDLLLARGTLTITDGSRVLVAQQPSCPALTLAPVVTCTAVLFTSNLWSGPHTISATYTDPGVFAPSSASLVQTVTPPAFSVSVSPAKAKVARGGSATFTVTTARTGPAGTVLLRAVDVPSGASATFNPTSVPAGGKSTLTVKAGTAAPQNYVIDVVGMDADVTHSFPIVVTVEP